MICHVTWPSSAERDLSATLLRTVTLPLRNSIWTSSIVCVGFSLIYTADEWERECDDRQNGTSKGEGDEDISR